APMKSFTDLFIRSPFCSADFQSAVSPIFNRLNVAQGRTAEREQPVAECNSALRGIRMKSFTDLFIRRPVLALVVNLVILIAGFQAIKTLTVRQYPRSENATVTVTTVYV